MGMSHEIEAEIATFAYLESQMTLKEVDNSAKITEQSETTDIII